jgi:hypothetical protein
MSLIQRIDIFLRLISNLSIKKYYLNISIFQKSRALEIKIEGSFKL